MQQAAVHIHAMTGRYERIASLPTAHGIERTYVWRLDPGFASFTIAANDPGASLGSISVGNRVVIESAYCPPWVGLISHPSENLDGYLTVGCLGLSALLDGREAPQNRTYSRATGSSAVLSELLRSANAQHPTGIRLASQSPSGPSIDDFSLGAQSVYAAILELMAATDYEAWLEHHAGPSGIDSILMWGPRQGRDNSDSLHLYEGAHWTALEYALDLSASKQALSMIGGTAALPARPRRGAFLDERQRRGILHQHGPYLERVSKDPTTDNLSELGRRGARELSRTVSASEYVTGTVNMLPDWRRLTCGDYFTLHARTTLGGDLHRVARLTGVQPSEEAGESILTAEIVVR